MNFKLCTSVMVFSLAALLGSCQQCGDVPESKADVLPSNTLSFESKEEAARELVRVSFLQVPQMQEALKAQVQIAIASGNEDINKEELLAAVQAELESPELLDRLASPYIQNFTTDEINELIEVAQKPAFRKQVALGTELSMHIMAAMNDAVASAVDHVKPIQETVTAAVKRASVIEMTREVFDHEVIGKGSVVVIDAYATWCGPCKRQDPIFRSVSKEFTDNVLFGKLDVDKQRDLANELNIQSMPTLLFYRDGKLVERHTGLIDESSLRRKVSTHLR